jgi:hypothetical protein
VFQSHARIGVMAVLCEARDAALVSGLRAIPHVHALRTASWQALLADGL